MAARCRILHIYSARFSHAATLSAGATPWNAALIYAGFVVGENYPQIEAALKPWEYVIYALVLLGRADEARASLEQAIKAAPDPESNVAVLARQQLDGLTNAAPFFSSASRNSR